MTPQVWSDTGSRWLRLKTLVQSSIRVLTVKHQPYRRTLRRRREPAADHRLDRRRIDGWYSTSLSVPPPPPHPVRLKTPSALKFCCSDGTDDVHARFRSVVMWQSASFAPPPPPPILLIRLLVTPSQWFLACWLNYSSRWYWRPFCFSCIACR